MPAQRMNAAEGLKECPGVLYGKFSCYRYYFNLGQLNSACSLILWMATKLA